MLAIAADPKHLGARIGITAVLHTWGSAMTHHPHIHMIVPGGGIVPDGRWISSRPAFLLPVRVLGALFRRLFLTRLLALHDASRLAFYGKTAGLSDHHAFQRHLAPARKKRWVVYARPPFAGPEAVLAYLSHYTHRVAISNSRLNGKFAIGLIGHFRPIWAILIAIDEVLLIPFYVHEVAINEVIILAPRTKAGAHVIREDLDKNLRNFLLAGRHIHEEGLQLLFLNELDAYAGTEGGWVPPNPVGIDFKACPSSDALAQIGFAIFG